MTSEMTPNSEAAVIYSLPLGDETYSLLNISSAGKSSSVDIYNIIMMDSSGSMSWVIEDLFKGWNNIVANKIIGQTDLYTFGSEVNYRRSGSVLKDGDFDCSGYDNLTDALEVIRKKLDAAPESLLRVFLINDGGHNATEKMPEEEICLMSPPVGKTVEVYYLGIGDGFPVQYSVDIRSRLHNGSSSCPTLFWIRETEEVDAECEIIVEEMAKALAKVKVSIPGRTLPHLADTKDFVYVGEYLLYPMDPNTLKNQLKLFDQNDEPISIAETIKEVSPELLISNVFKQWNSILIQRHRNKQEVPMEVFDLMKRAFLIHQEKIEKSFVAEDSVKSRLINKEKKRLITEFQTMMNQSLKVITIENKFENDIELANAIFRTAVQGSKFETKLLGMRGHGSDEWKDDVKEFKKVYSSKVDLIKSLPEPEFDDCCRVLLCSFVSDLQDESFTDLLEMNKMDFLSNISMTGIPVFAPISDSSQINCWTLNVKNICTSPFEILSQRSMESSLAMNGTNATSVDKEIILQADNINSKYNTIVPIIPQKYCKTLKSLVRTNLFSVASTFCILKNPLIMDNWCHFAALACVWMKSIEDYIPSDRPAFIKKRILDVEETAKLYLDRKNIVSYIKVLIEKPEMAIMAESTECFEDMTIRCESLIKPAFFLHLMKEQLLNTDDAKNLIIKIIKLVLMEFIGRCLSSDTRLNSYSYYMKSDDDHKKKDSKTSDMVQLLKTKMNIDERNLLSDYYSEVAMKKSIRTQVIDVVETYMKGYELSYNPCPRQSKLEKLHNIGSAGALRWNSLVSWIQEVAHSYSVEGKDPLLSQEDVKHLLSEDMICVYLNHSLTHRKSSDRLSNEMKSVEETKKTITEKLLKEEKYFINTTVKEKLLDEISKKWRSEYKESHKEIAVPLSKEQIVAEATARGIEVTVDTFDTIYKYREKVGLCRNCCHVRSCPYFLRPNNKFNCHIEAERKNVSDYLHTLHLVVSANVTDASKCVDIVKSGAITGTNERKKPKAPENSDDISKCVAELQQSYNNFQLTN